jgi:hypothetical protein
VVTVYQSTPTLEGCRYHQTFDAPEIPQNTETVIVYMRRSMAIRPWKSAGKRPSVELISTNSVGKRIVAGYSSCQSQRDLQFARHTSLLFE